MDIMMGSTDGSLRSSEPGRTCSACARKGKQSRLQTFQLNHDEAVYMCSDADCLFPLDNRNLDSVVVKRKIGAGDIGIHKRRRKQTGEQRSVANQMNGICTANGSTGLSSSNHAQLSCDFEQQQKSYNVHSSVMCEAISDTNSYLKTSLSSPVTFSSYSKTLVASCNSVTVTSTAPSLSSLSPSPCATVSVTSVTVLPVNVIPVLKPVSVTSDVILPHSTNYMTDTASPISPINEQHSTAVQQPEEAKYTNLPLKHVVNQADLTGGKCSKNVQHSEVAKFRTFEKTPSVERISKVQEFSSHGLADRLYLHWTNSDMLCWLDVAMAMIVHCQSLRCIVESNVEKFNDKSCILRLINYYDRAQASFRRSSKLKRCYYLCGQGKQVKLETSVGCITVKTGGGDNGVSWHTDLSTLLNPSECFTTINVDDISGIVSDSEPNTTSVEQIMQESRRLDEEAKKLLIDVRDFVFEKMQEAMNCQRGKHDSSLLCLAALLSADSLISDTFSVKYSFTLTCDKCGHMEKNSVCKEVPTFMRLPEMFRMNDPCFLRQCFLCLERDQVLRIKFEYLPEAFYCHFLDGVTVSDITKYDFTYCERRYVVTGVVQYITKRSHFVCHFRQTDDNSWMTYDDLKLSTACQFTRHTLSMPPSEVHIVLWESKPVSAKSGDEVSSFSSDAISAACSEQQKQNVANASVASIKSILKDKPFVAPTVPVRQKSSVAIQPLISLQPDVKSQPLRPINMVSVTCSSDDRLQRAREKFLRDQLGARPPSTPLPIPIVTSISRLSNGASLTKQGFQSSVKTSTTSAVGRNARVSVQTSMFPSSSTSTLAHRVQAPSQPATRFKGSLPSLYEPVLPRLYKSYGHQPLKSPVFSGYVPRARQTTSDVTAAQGVLVEDNKSMPTTQPTAEDTRRPKVCFTLPSSKIPESLPLKNHFTVASEPGEPSAVNDLSALDSSDSDGHTRDVTDGQGRNEDLLDFLLDDILSGTNAAADVQGTNDDDLFLRQPITDFTFDDMLSYLYN